MSVKIEDVDAYTSARYGFRTLGWGLEHEFDPGVRIVQSLDFNIRGPEVDREYRFDHWTICNYEVLGKTAEDIAELFHRLFQVASQRDHFKYAVFVQHSIDQDMVAYVARISGESHCLDDLKPPIPIPAS